MTKTRNRKQAGSPSPALEPPAPGAEPTEAQSRLPSASSPLRFNYRRASAETAATQTLHKRRHPPVRRWKLVRLANHGRVDVVGESNYQAALAEITGRRDFSEVQYECMAILIPEPRNPHDANAIRVEIKRRKVGYFSREDAAVYSPYLRRLAQHGKLACCEAFISGRGEGPDTLTNNMGVFLSISPPGPELLATT